MKRITIFLLILGLAVSFLGMEMIIHKTDNTEISIPINEIESITFEDYEPETVATPTFVPPGGTYTSPQSIEILCATVDATIRYTTDGTDPTNISPIYTIPIEISVDITIKARAYKDGWMESEIAEANYIIDVIPGEMIFVQGGTFNPTATYTVTLSSYYIGKYEVTQAEYEAVMGTNPSSFGGNPDRPVERVSWFKAIEYCNRLSITEGLTPAYSYSTYGTNPDNWPADWNMDSANHTNVSCNWSADGYRLPTEMEWMFAALGGNQSQGYTYSGSNNIDEVAWWYYNSNIGDGQGIRTHDVGTKAPNELMTYDMSGNVYERCWDIWDSSFPSGSYTNPTGPVSGSTRVKRGGSFYSGIASLCAIANRGVASTAGAFGYDCGFRVCRISP